METRCYDRSTGFAVDAPYEALLIEKGRPGRRLGFAVASQPGAPSYTPDPFYSRNSSGGSVTITRAAKGTYSVHFAGLQRLSGHTDHVQLSAHGVNFFVACTTPSFGNSGNGYDVTVVCRDRLGNQTDSFFTVLVIE